MAKIRVPYSPLFIFSLCVLLAACGSDPQMDEAIPAKWDSEERIYRIQAGETGIFAANESDLFFYPYSGETGWTSMGLSRYLDENVSVRDFILFQDNRLKVSRAGDIPMWRTLDFGESWTPLGNNLDFDIVSGLETTPGKDTLYALSTASVARSTDFGNSWTLLLDGSKNGRFIKVDPNNTDHIWTGGFGINFQTYLDRSLDGGTTWDHLRPKNLGLMAWDLVLHPSETGTMLMGINGNISVIRSEDFGESWERLVENRPVRALANGKTATDRVYAAGWGHESLKMSLLISDDFGDNWDILVYESGPDSVTVNDLAVSVSGGVETVFLATDRHGVFQYSDGVFSPVE